MDLQEVDAAASIATYHSIGSIFFITGCQRKAFDGPECEAKPELGLRSDSEDKLIGSARVLMHSGRHRFEIDEDKCPKKVIPVYHPGKVINMTATVITEKPQLK